MPSGVQPSGQLTPSGMEILKTLQLFKRFGIQQQQRQQLYLPVAVAVGVVVLLLLLQCIVQKKEQPLVPQLTDTQHPG